MSPRKRRKKPKQCKVTVAVSIGNDGYTKTHTFSVIRSRLPASFGVEGLMLTVDQEREKTNNVGEKKAPREAKGRKFLEVALPPARRADLPTWKKYGVLNISKKERTFFPPYGVKFVLETPRGTFNVKMASARKEEKDKYKGGYISSATAFFKAHSDLQVGDTLVFEKTGSCTYRVHVKTE